MVICKINKLVIRIFFGSIMLMFYSCAHKSGHLRSAQNINSLSPTTSTQEPLSYKNDGEEEEYTKVRMQKENGVYIVPIIVNGLNLNFIFDTGASSISISAAEATVMLRQGKIKEDDIIGEAQFLDAEGEISEGTVVLLHTVQIGNIILKNVEASVTDNIQAPLLLGQSALAKFGKVTIDYNENTIEFNKSRR